MILKLLLVEDDIWIRSALAHRLQMAGFKVFTATNGNEGLALLRSAVNVDLVLTDLSMPNMDGAELVEQIRAHFPQIRIFMSSAQLPPRHVYLMLDGYFAKPLDVDTFTSYVNTT